MAREKLNEIEKIISEGIGDETIGENESAKWLRRRLRALVRKAINSGRDLQRAVPSYVLEEEQREDIFEKFGVRP